jgi:putative ABC transport system permease protein
MREVLRLALRYLAYHRVKTAVLAASITLIVYLPIGLRVLVDQSADELVSRAEATPLLLGTQGSPLELALSSLYFETDPPRETHFGEIARVAETELALPIPLYSRFRSRQYAIVGTSLEYFEFRGLDTQEGRLFITLGECVLGAEAAASLGKKPGDTVVSSPETVFDIAGTYPLKMKVVGVLERSFSPDDRAVFVDLKTSWVIAGLGHGHQDLAKRQAASAVLSREEDRIVANASVVQYNEITADNLDSFHFHGDLSTYPITGIIAVPNDEKSGVLLRGRFDVGEETLQIVRPTEVMDELLATILTIRSFVVAGLVVVGAATLATAVLVFSLSLRLRRREIDTLVKIGGSRARVAGVLVTEIVAVLVTAGFAATSLTLLTRLYGPTLVRAFFLQQ